MPNKGKVLRKEIEISLTGGLTSIIVFIMILNMFMGCSTPQKEFNPYFAGPQLIVEPKKIHLGVAELLDTEIVFRGKGFVPKDSVFVKLVGVKIKNQFVDIPIANGRVDNRGYFTAQVSRMVKVTELLRADIELDDEMEPRVIIFQPPIPKGRYTVRAESMVYDRKADSEIVVKMPSLSGSLKDFIGRGVGKIVRK
jgi:hypothetical protein